ncbi:MAG: ABC transporter permease [Acidobacteria bacterium]|nr:ABC transporter permease [Acidobacteriota bacterium]
MGGTGVARVAVGRKRGTRRRRTEPVAPREVVAQVALCLVLLASGALVLRSFERLWRTDPGFQPEGLFTVRLRVPPQFFPKTSEAFAFQDRVRHALAAIPGVTGASATSVLPLTAASFPYQRTITIPGAPGNAGDAERDNVLVDMIDARPNYVEAMGMRLRAGRTFTELLPKAVGEAIIDTALARRFFPESKPLGWQIQIGNQPFAIIGVVDQARLYDVHADGRPQILVRAENFGARPLFFVMRTNRGPRSLLPEVQAAIHGIDERVPAGEPRAMEDLVQAALSPQAMGGVLIGAFAAVRCFWQRWGSSAWCRARSRGGATNWR